jgi:sortase A
MFARILGAVGRTLITAGTLILLFVAYQLWGTNLQEAKSQKVLKREFAERTAEIRSTSTTAPPSTTTTPTTLPGVTTTTGGFRVVPVTVLPVDLPRPKPGEAMARIRIPKIGVDKTVVEGVTLTQLKRGAGHYPESPLPGQKGNAAIAGHRTTYGAPFHNVDKLAKGDQIQVETIQGKFVYEIDSIEIVKPDDVRVLDDKGDNRITLTACHPKYSARERIIISGVLRGKPVPPLKGQEEARRKAARNDGDGNPDTVQVDLDGGLSGIKQSKTPAILWGILCALIWLATWAVTVVIRRRSDPERRRNRILAWSPYLVGLPVFLVALYVFFENFARLLPGNY